MTDLYLASGSPRRRELLAQIGVRFDVLHLRNAAPRGADVDELQYPGEAGVDYVERMAREKLAAARSIMQRRGLAPRAVLAADTVVLLDGAVLGKPRDRAEAIAFLARMSGRAHEVRTAVAVAGRVQVADTSVSLVYFRPLTGAEIERHADSDEPYDKAGGYAIQGRGALYAERIDGSHSGIIGLPLVQTARLLARAGVPLP
jgi:septum formation protein